MSDVLFRTIIILFYTLVLYTRSFAQTTATLDIDNSVESMYIPIDHVGFRKRGAERTARLGVLGHKMDSTVLRGEKKIQKNHHQSSLSQRN